MNPRSIDDATILYFGLKQALQERNAEEFLSQELLEKIADRLIMNENNSRMPSPWLFMYRAKEMDLMGSFFTEHPVGLFDESTGPTVEHIANLKERAFDDLEAEPNSAICWSVMRLFSYIKLDASKQEKMSAALQKLNLVEMISHNEDDISLLQIIGTCVLRIGTIESRTYMLGQLDQVAKYYSNKYPGKVRRVASPEEDLQCKALWQLVEGAAALSQGHDLSESFGRFGETLVRLANVWPGATSLLREIADNTIRSIRTKHSGNLWKSFLLLRAMD